MLTSRYTVFASTGSTCAIFTCTEGPTPSSKRVQLVPPSALRSSAALPFGEEAPGNAKVVAYTTAGVEAAISTLTSLSSACTCEVPLWRIAGPKVRPPSADGNSEAPAAPGQAIASTEEGFDGAMKASTTSNPEIDPVARVQVQRSELLERASWCAATTLPLGPAW